MSANSFPDDADRAAIWPMPVDRDIAACVAADWGMVMGDFIEQAFLGVDNKKANNPDGWRIGFPTPTAYRDEWLQPGSAGCLPYPMGKVV